MSLRGCSMATSILPSQTFTLQITIYFEGTWDFMHKHVHGNGVNMNIPLFRKKKMETN
jgi:hypothetical protein